MPMPYGGPEPMSLPMRGGRGAVGPAEGVGALDGPQGSEGGGSEGLTQGEGPESEPVPWRAHKQSIGNQ